ncbi:hypothetical protein PVA45_08660 (plasmid) [Entomospira entomophila]
MHNEELNYYASVLGFQYALSQPLPKYGSKGASGWHTIARPLTWKVVQQHVSHKKTIGTLSRWYPSFGVIDIDDNNIAFMESIRKSMNLNDSNSLVQASESENSYHVYFKPVSKGKPVTINYYKNAMHWLEPFCEIYPQENRFIRLPFDKSSRGVLDASGLPRKVDFREGLTRLKGLAPYELPSIDYYSDSAPLESLYGNMDKLALVRSKQEGAILWQEGLQAPSSRLDSTKKVILFLWSNNIPLEQAKQEVRKWLKNKHNGFSKDFKNHPRKTYTQGDSLVEWIYHHYRRLHTLPDSTHNLDNGFLTPALLHKAIDLSKGNLPLLRFSTKLLAYASTRISQYNSTLSIHSDRLKEWSSSANYLRYVRDMQQTGLLGARSDAYSVDRYAKKIDASMLVHEYEEAKAIHSQEDKERVASTLEEWLKAVYPKASDYASKLK